jgi:hypothetical protein
MAARILLVLLLLTTLVCADDETTWSKSVNGLRARLVIPAHQERGLDPEVWVYLELQNTLAVLGNRKVFFTPDCLSLQITDENGQNVAPPSPPLTYDPTDPVADASQPLILPFDSTLRFRINRHATSIPGDPCLVIDLPGAVAIAASSDTHTYFISGTLTIRAQPDHPAMAWQGTLDLGKIQVPAP